MELDILKNTLLRTRRLVCQATVQTNIARLKIKLRNNEIETKVIASEVVNGKGSSFKLTSDSPTCMVGLSYFKTGVND